MQDMKQLSYTLVDTTSMMRVTTLSKDEKAKVKKASTLLGLRRSEFYRRAIIEKAQSVLSSTSTDISDNTRASSDRGGASFCEEE